MKTQISDHQQKCAEYAVELEEYYKLEEACVQKQQLYDEKFLEFQSRHKEIKGMSVEDIKNLISKEQ